MDLTPRFTRHDETSGGPRRVRVPGRDDIGEVVDNGKNFGTNPAIYCLGIYFPKTGECLYYDRNRVEDVDDP